MDGQSQDLPRQSERADGRTARRPRRPLRAQGKGHGIMVYIPVPPDVEAVAHECITAGIDGPSSSRAGIQRDRSTSARSVWSCDSRGVQFESEKRILVPYKSWMIAGQKVDLIVEGKVLIELKAVPRLRKIHQQQALSYLKATGPAPRPADEFQQPAAARRAQKGSAVRSSSCS